ncbi:PH domain-containing protein [Brachybacterium sp. DNPG3]
MHGQILHVSQFHAGLRWLQRISLALVALVGGLVLVLMAVVPAVRLLSSETPSSEAWTGVLVVGVPFLLGFVLLLGIIALVWRNSRQAFTVTTAGVEVRGMLRRRWIPWEQVARVETSDHWYWRRATCIATMSGERVVAPITAYQLLHLRDGLVGSADPSRHDPRVPQPSTRIAADVHRRWLAGEFGAR